MSGAEGNEFETPPYYERLREGKGSRIGSRPHALTRMQSEWSLAATRGAYIARQVPRLLWYVGHGYVMGRLAERARAQNGNSERRHNHTNAPVLDRRRLYRDMAALFRTDLANVEAGLYPLPRD